jgi:hypothetical protein
VKSKILQSTLRLDGLDDALLIEIFEVPNGPDKVACEMRQNFVEQLVDASQRN